VQVLGSPPTTKGKNVKSINLFGTQLKLV